MPSLFDPYDLGPIHLKNRIVMAPMERSRARNCDWAPEADTARYFSQRAGAGLIVTGSIAISAWARTWAFEPGLYTPTQVEAWRHVAKEVHDHGGVLFGQLRHGGRASHFSHQPNGQATVSSTERPSAVTGSPVPQRGPIIDTASVAALLRSLGLGQPRGRRPWRRRFS